MKYRHQNLRKGRTSIPGAYYHIIVCTHQRKEVLADKRVASIIFKAFDWLEAEHRLEWVCIMVMPDHLHTVIKLEEGQTLSKVLHSMKRYTAREINKHFSREGPFWQKGYTDWGIRKEATLNDTVRYCYANPVRKGLVARDGRDEVENLAYRGNLAYRDWVDGGRSEDTILAYWTYRTWNVKIFVSFWEFLRFY